MPTVAGCLLITLCCVSGAVIEAPQSEVSLVGRPSLLRCRAVSGSKLRSWSFRRSFENVSVTIYSNYGGGSPTVNCSKCSVFVDLHNSTVLYFNSTQMQDGGIYTCTVEDYGYEVKFQTELVVLDPHIQCESDHLKGELKGIMEYNNIEIWCNFSFAGNIVPVKKWFRNNDKISSSSQIGKYVSKIGWFHFKTVLQLNASDNGMSFRCEVDFETLNSSKSLQSKLSNATNALNAFKWNFTAVVWYMPKNIRVGSVKTIYNFGDRVECSADGNPSPNITWSCDVGTTREGSLLTLDSDTFEADVNYTCQCTAKNSIFGTNVSETVIIRIANETDNVWTTPPLIVIADSVVVIVVVAAVVVSAVAVAAVVIYIESKAAPAAAADTSNKSTEIPVSDEVRKPFAENTSKPEFSAESSENYTTLKDVHLRPDAAIYTHLEKRASPSGGKALKGQR